MSKESNHKIKATHVKRLFIRHNVDSEHDIDNHELILEQQEDE
ncbi:MAG: hypothetical protein ABSB10_02945 [Candidatus Bathyarchaeia archaeon]